MFLVQQMRHDGMAWRDKAEFLTRDEAVAEANKLQARFPHGTFRVIRGQLPRYRPFAYP